MPGCVLVRVRYSLISTGTEIASLRPEHFEQDETKIEKAKAYASLARKYLGLAIRYPDRAAVRASQIICRSASRFIPQKKAPEPKIVSSMNDLQWVKYGAKRIDVCEGGYLEIVTDDSEFGYQVMTTKIRVKPGMVPVIQVKGNVLEGAVSMGLLNESEESWLGSRNYNEGSFEDSLVFELCSSNTVTMVIANAGLKKTSRIRLEDVNVLMSPPSEDGLPLSELDDQGWNVGYSAAGEAVVVGNGITDLKPGDFVACAGAGLANHADYVSVPRNLVCRVPEGCSLRDAATTTVGTIAFQGVRRAAPQLGERICVIGLGLIGQITVQLLRASGCAVIGTDLDPKRVDRAKRFGMEAGASDPGEYKLLVRDMTEGRGADRTIITAATKSDAVINLSMEVTRAKGTVVIVGDVGLNVERQHFYRKEIDFLMSTSYGPGRYDRTYEIEGRDYPFPYVRWTANRNMRAYMELIASRRLNIEALIDRVVSVTEAPQVYQELASGEGSLPLGVIIHYPDETRELPEPPDSSKIIIRGHRKAPEGPIRYALVGAGAFGTCMLVPQMNKRKDRFFLRGVVSRDTTRGGNFARMNRVEILATDLDEVLNDPGIDLVVIATRHHEHAEQVIKSLRAGKHVFVEKPLALTWDELDCVVGTYEQLKEPPLLMVGFNRRFSPAISALREAIKGRRSPLMINYRLNGGYIPPDHWIQGAQGGGRNIGEACHMFDVFRFLAGVPVSGIDASSINPGRLPFLRNDNFCATITYKDGSVGNLVYTALGPKQGLPKERIEVFCDGEAYIVDDFKSLFRAGDGKILWHNDEGGKGHLEELSRFGDAIAGLRDVPIPFEEIVETMAVTLHVEDLICDGGGLE